MRPRADRAARTSIRAFVAAELPRDLQGRAAAVQERLKAARADVKWVESERLHLTLKFLGQVEVSAVGPIIDAIRSVTSGRAAVRLALAGVGAFPQVRAPRVIWVGVRDEARALTELQVQLDVRLEPLGFRREERSFAPHLTLGRVRGLARREQLALALASMSAEPLGEMLVDRIALMQSDLRPEGPHYTVLHSFPLERRA
jgi:2'-5' RNA ligase